MIMHCSLLALCLASSLAFAASACAALPPLYESAKEIRALLESPKLGELLGSGDAIQSITKVDDGFIVATTKHIIKVDVVYDPVDHPGPAKFHLVFHEKQ
jgi:hypothetical protein